MYGTLTPGTNGVNIEVEDCCGDSLLLIEVVEVADLIELKIMYSKRPVEEMEVNKPTSAPQR